MASITEVGASEINTQKKEPDKLVLVDAYWIKKYNGFENKIRVLPHQKPVDLFIEFVYEHDDDAHDKYTAPAFDVRFKIEGTIFDGKSTITIDSSKLTKWKPDRQYDGPNSKYNGRNLYYYEFKDFVSDLYPVNHRVDMTDEIVLKDAYWEKDGMKIRILPHQKKVKLIVVCGFKYNKVNYNKENAELRLKFSIPGTVFPQDNEDVVKVIKGSELLQCDKIFDKKGNECYLYPIDNFSSDLAEVEY